MPKKYLSSKLIKFILAVVFCLILIFFVSPKIFAPFRFILAEIAYPFEKSFYLIGRKTSDIAGLLGSIYSLKNENAVLIEKNNDLKAQIAMLEDQKNENVNLRKQLDLAPRNKFNLRAALVIGEDPKSGAWVSIDKGRADGIQTNMPVIVSSGILVGKIKEVYENSSQVELISDSQSAVNAIDLETNAKGIVQGSYGLGLVMDMVEESDTLNPGDSVATSGLGGIFPAGLLIGKIQQAVDSPDKLFQRALLTPEVKYTNLDSVFVITNK